MLRNEILTTQSYSKQGLWILFYFYSNLIVISEYMNDIAHDFLEKLLDLEKGRHLCD